MQEFSRKCLSSINNNWLVNSMLILWLKIQSVLLSVSAANLKVFIIYMRILCVFPNYYCQH